MASSCLLCDHWHSTFRYTSSELGLKLGLKLDGVLQLANVPTFESFRAKISVKPNHQMITGNWNKNHRSKAFTFSENTNFHYLINDF